MFTKQIGVRRVLPSHADSSCGGEKVGGKMLRRFGRSTPILVSEKVWISLINFSHTFFNRFSLHLQLVDLPFGYG